MAFVKAGSLDQFGPDGMASFFVEGVEVLVVRDRQGALHAFDGLCPHEDTPLVDGNFDGAMITCATHGWMFDAFTGEGINPPGCRLGAYPVKSEGSDIYIDLDGELK
jgi:toluene monooxygenase system ferredoxin subunit